jgi:hypothetical protein
MEIFCKTKKEMVAQAESGLLQKQEPVIVCAACYFAVTDPSRQIRVHDSFSHVFANPYGQVFEIGCFSKARGCRQNSIPSEEFSWFSGYAWQVGICRGCNSHLGWIFSNHNHLFYGLILDKLIFP